MSEKRTIGVGVVKRVLQEFDPQHDKASEGSDHERWRTHKTLNFDDTWTNTYGNYFK